MKINLKDLIDEMDMQSDTIFVYYKKDTNEFVFYNEDEPDLNDYDIEEIEDSDNFLPIPSKFDIHEYQIMESFCYSIPDEIIKEKALAAIIGSGAFRRFKDLIFGSRFEETWYSFKEEELKKHAISWCEFNELEYE